jgi:ribonuclease/clavin/mitogillin
MAFVLEEEDAMFTGDNVLGHGTAVFEDLSQYLSSLDAMKNAFSGKAYPGHGVVVENGKARIDEYIAHRKKREDEVLQALTPTASGAPMSSMDVVKVVYKDVAETLHIPAQGGVLQVLAKLRSEGKVVETGEKYRLADRAAL